MQLRNNVSHCGSRIDREHWAAQAFAGRLFSMPLWPRSASILLHHLWPLTGSRPAALMSLPPDRCLSKVRWREMAKTSSAPRRDGLQCDRLPFRWAALLVAIMAIASWVAIIVAARLAFAGHQHLAAIFEAKSSRRTISSPNRPVRRVTADAATRMPSYQPSGPSCTWALVEIVLRHQ